MVYYCFTHIIHIGIGGRGGPPNNGPYIDTDINAKFVLISPFPVEGKSSPPIKKLGLVIQLKKPTNLPANGSRFLFSVAASLGWDGEIGHGTSIQQKH